MLGNRTRYIPTFSAVSQPTALPRAPLDISREVNLYVGSTGVSFKLRINFSVFCLLNVYGRGVGWLSFCVNRFDNLYTGAFRQFTMGG